MLPPRIGARTVSVYDVGDPLCDCDSETSKLSAADLAIDTSFTPTAGGVHAWGGPVYNLVANAAPVLAPIPTSTTALTASGSLG
jgi:cutinase